MTVSSLSKTMFVVLLPVSLRELVIEVDETYICGHLHVTLLVFLSFVLPILEYCSLVWRSAAECHHQLLERQVYSVARLCPDESFLSLCYRRRVAWRRKLYKVISNSNLCMSVQFFPLMTVLLVFIIILIIWTHGGHFC